MTNPMTHTPQPEPGSDADGRILDAAQSLIGHHSIVTVVRNEAERLNKLGYTATSRRMYEAAHKLDKLFDALEPTPASEEAHDDTR